MNRTSISKDHADHTMTIRRRFHAPRLLAWRAHSEPALLDQWWAPRPYRAETVTMDFRVGGHWHYAMVGPGGERHFGRMDYVDIEPEHHIVADDVFADESGAANDAMPRQRLTLRFTDAGDATDVVEVVRYRNAEDLQKVIEMGIEEGLTAAQNQLEELLQTLQS